MWPRNGANVAPLLTACPPVAHGIGMVTNATETAANLRELLNGNVRAELARHRMSSADLEGILGRSRHYVRSRMEGFQPWSGEDLIVIAEALGTTAEVLVKQAV